MSDRKLPNPAERFHRPLTVERDHLATRAEGDDRIPVAISSEIAVERYYGMEILVHTRAAINLQYASRGGLPFLANHDPAHQLGVAENLTLGADRRLRAMLRKGNHPDADWFFRDIEDGIRQSISVGYRVDDLQPDPNTLNTYRAVRWTPLEVSTVAIPADHTVGVGRVAEQLNNPRGTSMSTEAEPSHRAGAAPVTLADQRQQIANIYQLAGAHGMTEHAPAWVERGLTIEQVKAEILDRKRAAAPAAHVVPGYLDMSERDTRDYTASFGRTLVAAADRRQPDGAAWEASQSIAKRLGRTTAGIFVPLDLNTRTSLTGNLAGTSSLGGAGIQTTLLPLIDLLRNKMLVRQAGATVISGLQGNISFPRQIVPNTMAWEGENPSTAHALTAATLDNVTLSPKTAMASSAYSRQFLIQASFDASSFVQNDLATVLALGADLAALDGTGSNNQPTGIMRQTGVTTITHGTTDGAVPDWASLVSYETNVAQNNGDVGSMAWVTTPGMRGKLKTVLKSTTAGSTYLWDLDQTINGYPAFATANMPSNYTRGTSTTVAHGAVFGVWSEVLIGEWGGALELIVDPFTSASQNMIVTTAIMMMDVGVRRPKALAISKSALIA